MRCGNGNLSNSRCVQIVAEWPSKSSGAIKTRERTLAGRGECLWLMRNRTSLAERKSILYAFQVPQLAPDCVDTLIDSTDALIVFVQSDVDAPHATVLTPSKLITAGKSQFNLQGDGTQATRVSPFKQRHQPQERAPPETSNIRQLKAILNTYPPNRSAPVASSRRKAASQRSGVSNRCDRPKITTTTTKSGSNDAIPSTTPMKRPLEARNAKGIEISWKER